MVQVTSSEGNDIGPVACKVRPSLEADFWARRSHPWCILPFFRLLGEKKPTWWYPSSLPTSGREEPSRLKSDSGPRGTQNHDDERWTLHWMKMMSFRNNVRLDDNAISQYKRTVVQSIVLLMRITDKLRVLYTVRINAR